MGIIVSITSHVLYYSEKLSLCFVAVLLVSCTVITITFTLAFGMGLGYNYCFVDLKTRYKYVPERYKYRGSPRWYGSQYPRSGKDTETNEEPLAAPAASYLDFNNPSNDPQSPEMNQDSEDFDEPHESLDDIRIPDDNTTEVAINSTVEASTEVTNATEVTTMSLQTKNDTDALRTTKMVIPLSGLDLIGLLTRLRAENKNYTLQIVTD